MTLLKDCFQNFRPSSGQIFHRCGGNSCKLHWLAAVLLLTPARGYGTDVSIGGSGGLAEEFNTNIFLTPNPHKEVLGQGFNANLNATISEDRWQSRWNADFVNRWYIGNSGLDYANQLFSTKNYYTVTERSRIGLDGSYKRDSTLSSIGDTSSDLGYVFRRLHRTIWEVSPNWMYSLNETTKLSTQYSHQETTYENTKEASGRAVDSLSHAGVATVEHQYAENLALRAVAVASTYEIPFEKQTSSFPAIVYQNGLPVFGLTTVTSGGSGFIDTQSLSLGFTYVPMETLKIDFSGGGQFNQVSNPGPKISFRPLLGNGVRETSFQSNSHSSSFSEILSAEATKSFERGEVGFSYSKSLSPNLLGILISYDRYSFTGRYRLTQQLASNIRLAVSETGMGGAVDSTTGQFFRRSQFEIGGGLAWTMTEQMSLNASYQYRQVEYPGTNREADDHAVFLRLQYTPDQIHF